MDQSLLVCHQADSIHSHMGPTAHLSDTSMTHHVSLSATLPPGKKSRVALLWGVGSAVLSGLGFVALALFEQYNGMIGELRNDLKHFNETQSSYVKRENFDKIKDKLREGFKELHEARTTRTQLEQELKASEKERADVVQELQRMRERLSYLEGRQTAVAPRTKALPPSGN